MIELNNVEALEFLTETFHIKIEFHATAYYKLV